MLAQYISKVINRFSTAKGGNLYTWGTTTYGWGRPATQSYYSPERVQLFNQNVTKVSTGKYHALILTNSNQLYSVGLGQDGRLGNGSSQTAQVPQLINYFKDNKIQIKDFSCGDRHNILISTQGKLYTWGYGGQSYFLSFLNHLLCKPNPLGLSGRLNRSVPTLVQSLNDIKFTSVAAGNDFSLALSQKNILYGWGKNAKGRLLNATQTQLPVELEQVSYFQHKKHTHIKKVKSAAGFSIILFDNGKLYTFGQNQDGVMGIRENPLVAVDKYTESLTPVIDEVFHGQKVIDFDVSQNSLVILTDAQNVYYSGLGLAFKPRLFPKQINGIKKIFATSESLGVVSNSNKIYYINDKFIDISDLDLKTNVYQVQDAVLAGDVIDIGGTYDLKYAIIN